MAVVSKGEQQKGLGESKSSKEVHCKSEKRNASVAKGRSVE